jgi:hypothetical protein
MRHDIFVTASEDWEKRLRIGLATFFIDCVKWYFSQKLLVTYIFCHIDFYKNNN